ncbi:sigma-70 family RNA polymerase sigma factor [Anaerobutyricum hallii]|nr:sigma-70 family RNA polymerase sigma factor [Anaerobutyricum hallii]
MFIYLMVLDTEEEKIKFVKIYDAYKDRMHYTASVILKDKLNAEDMVHDTFLTLTDYLDRIDEEDFTGTWNYIATILKNKCYNFIKKSKKIELIADDIIFEQSVEGYNLLESQLIKEESEEFLNSLIRGLKYPYKEVIYLQYYNKLNSRQIAEILETNSANVRKNIQSCERTVKERYVEKRIHL